MPAPVLERSGSAEGPHAMTHRGDRRRPLVAVLAGGAARRLGGAKATALLGGRPLISYPIAAARAAGFETVVVAKAASPLPEIARLGCEVVTETDERRHPLSGIVAALRHAARPVVALACDMPFVTPAMVGRIAAHGGGAVLTADGRLQPLPGLYLPDHLATLDDALAAGLPLREVVARLGMTELGERAIERFGKPATLCMNINDPGNLEAAEAALATLAGTASRDGAPQA